MKKYMWKFFNNKGFTLAEGMVTASLLGIVSLAMLQGLKEDSKTKAYARINDDIQTIMGAINNSMKDTTSCSASLNSVIPQAKATAPSASGIILYNSSGAFLKSPLPGYETINLQEGQAVGPGIELATIRVVNFAKFFSIDEQMANSSVTGATSYDYGSVELEVRFTKTTKLEAGAIGDSIFDTIERSVLVNINRPSTAGSGINACANLADLTALQLKQQVCGVRVRNFEGSFVDVGSFDPSDGSCKGVQESINWISAQKICIEAGGGLDATGNCIPFGAQGGTINCANGFSGIENGVPKCNP